MKMCSNLEVSILTFVLSMFLSYMIATYYQKVPMMYSICLAWQPVVLMSFFDALVLKEVRDQDGSMAGMYLSVFTFLLQPSLMGLLLLTREGISPIRRIIATMLIITHMYWYFYSLMIVTPLNSAIERLPYPDFVYCFTTINLFLLLVSHRDIALLLIIATILNYYVSSRCEESVIGISSVITYFTPVLLSLYWEKYYATPEISFFGPRFE